MDLRSEQKTRGRPSPAQIRDCLLELALVSVHSADKIMDRDHLGDARLIHLIDTVLKHGLGHKIEIQIPDSNILGEIGKVSPRHLTSETYRGLEGDLRASLQNY